MTTPTDNTALGVVNDAYRDAGILARGSDLNGEELAEGMRRLRDVIYFLQTKGLKLFLLSDTAVPLTDGQATYTFAPAGNVAMDRPLRAIQGYYLYTATNVRRPIQSISWQEYLTLGMAGTLSSNRGTISQYFVNKQATQLSVTFWLCPDSTEASNGQAHVLLQQQASAVIELDQLTAFPDEWRMCLRWSLADDVCSGQPSEIMQRCAMKAAFYQDALENWDVEDTATYLQADPRTGVPGNFR